MWAGEAVCTRFRGTNCTFQLSEEQTARFSGNNSGTVTSLDKGNEVEQGHMLNDFASLP